MKVAYLLESNNVLTILENMIIPQMEENRHGADVMGMMFFFDNTFLLVKGLPLAERINDLAKKTGMLVMACDRCCFQRGIEEKLISSARMGCFPDVYAALGKVGVDQVITL
jgi:hypothetical protein